MEKQINLDNIIQLKFNVEKEIQTLTSNFAKLKTDKQINISNDNKILLEQYKLNIDMFGEKYLKQQNILLKNIDKILLEKCNHCWIYDTIDEPLYSRDICYCSKCYLYKFKKIV
jgi:hypothetical protein